MSLYIDLMMSAFFRSYSSCVISLWSNSCLRIWRRSVGVRPSAGEGAFDCAVVAGAAATGRSWKLVMHAELEKLPLLFAPYLHLRRVNSALRRLRNPIAAPITGPPIQLL
jgi:hypothetical protein